MEGFHFKGKKILITHPFIYEINGATNVTLELASFLQSQQANVTVFTYVYANPAKEYFEKAGIKVDLVSNDTKHHLKDYDYIWINSQTLPPSLLDEFKDKKNLQKMPKLIFMHMAAHDYCPDEMPFLYGFEEEVSSLSLFVSEETFDFNNKYYEKTPENIGFYRNPASLDFYNSFYRKSKMPKRLLVVENSLCDELKALRPLLSKKHITIDYLGRDGDRYELVTSEMLSQYDAVITFGKTVQYCLVSNTPVYIYGTFGGPGWLTKDNFKEAEKNNFSGRGFSNKTADEIVEELLSDYDAAKNYQNDNHALFCDDFLIDRVIPRIFEQADKSKKSTKPISLARISAYSSMLFLMHVCFDNRYCYDDMRAVNNRLNTVIDELNAKIAALEKRNNEMSSAINSRSVKALLKLSSVVNRKKK